MHGYCNLHKRNLNVSTPSCYSFG